MEYRVISIGALSQNPIWDEKIPVRTSHATTTLIKAGDRNILVDPGLPPEALVARLNERSGLLPNQITDIFLTNFRPAHRRGISAFDGAKWWIAEAEREAMGQHLIEQFEAIDDEEARDILRQEIALLQRIKAAEDSLAQGVDLFPLPGFTPGTCGLLLTLSSATVLIAGDGVISEEHMSAGKVLQRCYDVKQAQESLLEAVEIADWVIAGHDNIFPNMTRRMF